MRKKIEDIKRGPIPRLAWELQRPLHLSGADLVVTGAERHEWGIVCSCPMYFNTVCDRWKWKCMQRTTAEDGTRERRDGRGGERGEW